MRGKYSPPAVEPKVPAKVINHDRVPASEQLERIFLPDGGVRASLEPRAR